MKAPVFVIYNPHAGASCVRALRGAFKRQGIHATFHCLKPDLKHTLDMAARDGCEIVAAAGGDGTVSGVVDWIKGTSLQLLIIPTGTLNHFAKDLKIPLEIDKAISIIHTGVARKIDVGFINDRAFINNSSLGIYPAIVHEREKQQHIFGKWLSLLLAIGKLAFKIKNYNLTISIDSKTYTRNTPFIFIGNNMYHIDNVGLSHRERLDTGMLCVYIVKTVRPFHIAHIIGRMLLGKIEKRYFESFTAKNITIESSYTEMRVAYDGEVGSYKTPLAYKVGPKMLTVLLPRA